jgi:hypothetical protein
MTETTHIADRPSFDCRACGEPWPCVPAQENLLREHAERR